MTNYVRELRAGEIISCTFALYRQNIGALLLIVGLPSVPFFLAGGYMGKEHLIGTHLPAYLALIAVSFLVGLLTTGLATVLISDVCVGNKAQPLRAVRHVVKTVLGRLFRASLLQFIVVAGGLVLLLIPGIIFASWYIITPVVVALEGVQGRRAMARSKQLCKGFYLRSLAIVALLGAIAAVIGGVIGALSGVIAHAFFDDSAWPTIVVSGGLQALAAPISLVAIVLIYYDLRVRKEGFTMTQLSEELRL